VLFYSGHPIGTQKTVQSSNIVHPALYAGVFGVALTFGLLP